MNKKTHKFFWKHDYFLAGSISSQVLLNYGSQAGSMLATFSTKWGVFVGSLPLFCCVGIFVSIFCAAGRWGTPFLAPWADGVPHFWRQGAMEYPDFGSIFVPSWHYFGPFGVGLWGCAKRKEFLEPAWNWNRTEPNQFWAQTEPKRTEPLLFCLTPQEFFRQNLSLYNKTCWNKLARRNARSD